MRLYTVCKLVGLNRNTDERQGAMPTFYRLKEPAQSLPAFYCGPARVVVDPDEVVVDPDEVVLLVPHGMLSPLQAHPGLHPACPVLRQVVGLESLPADAKRGVGL